jgi:hypothetical protein|tara:strand:+ start:20075 stop:20692 length:618 start_codon:yes stop_codon:yes gene_type:complete
MAIRCFADIYNKVHMKNKFLTQQDRIDNLKNRGNKIKKTFNKEFNKIKRIDEKVLFINESENPCWDGYIQVGMKEKDGKQVPNCVPKNSESVISIPNQTDINEDTKKKGLINIEKLIKYAEAIEVMCNGEYGVTYLHEEENKVFVMLGDSNPFDSEYLIMYMKEAISDGWRNADKIDIEIENEGGPSGEGWQEIKKGKLIAMRTT